jgi:hypothetical protein
VFQGFEGPAAPYHRKDSAKEYENLFKHVVRLKLTKLSFVSKSAIKNQCVDLGHDQIRALSPPQIYISETFYIIECTESTILYLFAIIFLYLCQVKFNTNQ